MNNPIEKRFKDLVQKWTTAINTTDVTIVRIHANHDEKTFVNDFLEYMLAVDSNQNDLVFLLDSPWEELATFSKILLQELSETIHIWNTATKEETLPQEKVAWQPDFTLEDTNNPAALFVSNINSLATLLVPEKDTLVSFFIKMPFAPKTKANKWLENVLKCPLASHIRIGIADADTHPIFNKIAANFPKQVYTLHPHLDMDAALEEVAALGDPTAPDTSYRKHLAMLMNGVKDRDQKKVAINSKKCLEIAANTIKKDANWLGQMVLVYTVLYNNEIGNKDYKKALFFADKAVEAGTLSIGRIEPSTAYRILGQALLGKGTIAGLLNKREIAADSYHLASTCFENCNDYTMYTESVRLFADEAVKVLRDEEALVLLVKCFKNIEVMPPETVTASTFPWVVKKLYHWSNRERLLSDQEMKTKLSPFFGENYMEKVNQFGKLKHIKKNTYQDN